MIHASEHKGWVIAVITKRERSGFAVRWIEVWRPSQVPHDDHGALPQVPNVWFALDEDAAAAGAARARTWIDLQMI